MSRITASDILKVVPITRKTLWLWQKKYRFFPDPEKEAHPGGKGIVGYYPLWVKERCQKVYSLQQKGYTIAMIQEYLKQELEEKSSKKILVVDDEKKFAVLLKKILVKKGYVVEMAHDGWDAGLKAAQFMPSLLILDINLPGVNGVEICKNLKSNPKTRNIQIITITADINYPEQDVLAAGADLYFTKPVDLNILLEECDKIIGNTLDQKKSVGF